MPTNAHDHPTPETRVSINKAAELAGVSRRTIYHWLKAGKLDIRRNAGGAIRINPQSLWAPSDKT